MFKNIIEPKLKIGLLESETPVMVRLNGPYRCVMDTLQNKFEARAENGCVVLRSQGSRERRGRELLLEPMDDSTFSISGVMIGIGFHWQRNEDLSFAGTLLITVSPEGRLVLINELEYGKISCQCSFLGNERNSSS